jgi:SAM-dependent methyltransferase
MTRPTIEEACTRAEAARGSRFSAFLYGPMLWWAERAGNAERRRRLLAGARGSVLEIGAGTGHNLSHYPNGLERLVLAEPEQNMARRLEGRVARVGVTAEVVRASAEALPFDDDSFDTVVSTFVLCTVEDPSTSAPSESDSPIGRTACTARGGRSPTAATATEGHTSCSNEQASGRRRSLTPSGAACPRSSGHS